MAEKSRRHQEKDQSTKTRLALFIGRGSRTPAIYELVGKPNSGLDLRLVVSHRKPKEGQEDVQGIALAKEFGYAGVYFNRVQMLNKAKALQPDLDDDGFKRQWEWHLGLFLKQETYNPDIIFMTGWDLVLHKEFLQFFPDRVINVHPSYLPDIDEDQQQLTLPNGSSSPVFRGSWDDIAPQIISSGVKYTGVTIHLVVPETYDVGPVIAREWVAIDSQETVESLRTKLNVVEDRLGPQVLLWYTKGQVKVGPSGKISIAEKS